MAWEDDFLNTMQPSDDGGTPGRGLQLGEMTGPTSCKVGGLELTKDDLKFAQHLLTTNCTKVKEIANSEGSVCTDKSAYLPALKAGDEVLLYQISDSLFLVIERMVRA